MPHLLLDLDLKTHFSFPRSAFFSPRAPQIVCLGLLYPSSALHSSASMCFIASAYLTQTHCPSELTRTITVIRYESQSLAYRVRHECDIISLHRVAVRIQS